MPRKERTKEHLLKEAKRLGIKGPLEDEQGRAQSSGRPPPLGTLQPFRRPPRQWASERAGRASNKGAAGISETRADPPKPGLQVRVLPPLFRRRKSAR
jgi:hypothetical protein